MRIVIDTDSKALYKDEYGCLVPFSALTESEQNKIGNALLDEVAKHNLFNRSESVEDMIKNLHKLVKCHIGVFNVTDDEEENTYKFITKFEDTISTGAISDTIMSTRILTSVDQYTYQRFRV